MESSLVKSVEADRRKGQRLDATHPIVLEWQAGAGDLHRARGTTRDIALGGVYCYVERPLASGEPVEFDMVLPGELGGGSPRKLRCSGRVLRSEKAPERGGYGVAVTIETSRVLAVLEPTIDIASQRVYARIIPPASLQAEYPGMRSAVRDLSLAGAFIEDERPLPIGRIFRLRLASPTLNAEMDVDAVVRRVEPHIGMAVEFVALSKEAKKTLEELVQQGGAWRGPEEAFPSHEWAAAGDKEGVTLDDAVAFVRERAARLLPGLEVVACRYRAGDRVFSLHLRDPISHAELLLPIGEAWVRECRDGDCTHMERALGSAARLLDLKPLLGNE